MLDPLTALGLAANVVQLISFTGDLLKKGRQISSSVDGQLLDHKALRIITTSLQELTNNLIVTASLQEHTKNSTSSSSGSKLTSTERQLQQICTGCSEASTSLLEALQTLHMQEKRGVWRSFRQALNCIWSEDKINALSARLEQYRRQIDTTLLVSLR
jgi:hypothetical protein